MVGLRVMEKGFDDVFYRLDAVDQWLVRVYYVA